MLRKMLRAGALAGSLMLATSAFAEDTSWVDRSNKIAYSVLESQAKFAPEFSSQTGVTGFDEEIFDLGENLSQRQIAAAQKNIDMLEALLAKETDPRVAQDLQIMIQSQKDNIEATQINYDRVMPYGNLNGLIFAGFRGQLDKQVPMERRKAALVRLKKYTGETRGYEPFVELAKQRLTERIVDLVRSSVGEILPFEIDLCTAEMITEPLSIGNWRRTADEGALQVGQLFHK